MTTPRPPRDYDAVCAALDPAGSREERLRRVVDALWTAFESRGVSWVGVYLDRPGEPDDRRLVLGPCRDRPACSPIGLHGACGRVVREGTPLVVRDVADLGDGYIPCDPRDRSEVVIPLADGNAPPWGVLDLDSFDVGAFDDRDVAGLQRVVAAAGVV